MHQKQPPAKVAVARGRSLAVPGAADAAKEVKAVNRLTARSLEMYLLIDFSSARKPAL
jgi:hypothetical protein